MIAGCGFQAPREAGDAQQPVSVGFVGTSSLQDELSGTVSIPVSLSAPAGDLVTVHYRFTGGSATNGADYVGTDNVLAIPPGATESKIPVTILRDAMEEPSETIEIMLSDPTNATIGTSMHTITINSDILPRVQFSAPTSTADEAVSPTFALELTTPSTAAVNVDYVVTGTATSGVDYTLTQGRVTFPPGTTSQQLMLPITDDLLDEFDENVLVTLTSSQNAVVGSTASHDHAIIDNDAEPTVSFTLASQNKGEETGSVNLAIQLSAPSGKPIKVDVLPGPATTLAATAGVDFAFPIATTVMFAPGVTQRTFSVALLNDTLDEFDEGFTAKLAVQAGYNVGLGTIVSDLVTLLDDDPLPRVAFVTASKIVLEGNSGVTNIVFQIQIDAVSGKPITVPIAIGGSASNPGDYSITGNPISIAPGATTGAITIGVVGDTVRESSNGGFSSVDMTIEANNQLTNVQRDNQNLVRSLTIKDDD